MTLARELRDGADDGTPTPKLGLTKSPAHATKPASRKAIFVQLLDRVDLSLCSQFDSRCTRDVCDSAS